MIGFLKGKVIDQVGDNALLVGVGSADSFVGYQVAVAGSLLNEPLLPGEPVQLFIHTHVREDAFQLFGFRKREELKFFELLLTVNGIGPKGAMSILSGGQLEDLVHAILEKDKEALTRIPGIGKKTAERLALELADPLRKAADKGEMDFGRGASGQRAGAKGQAAPVSSSWKEARLALLELGFKDFRVDTVLERVKEGLAGEPGAPVETIIRRSLQALQEHG